MKDLLTLLDYQIMNKIKKYFFILLLLELFFAYAPVYAQVTPTAQPTPVYSGGQQGVTQFLCTPDSPNVSGAPSGVLFACINQIYKFAIVLASVVGVFFIVIAGYIYMSADGNAESVDKAKDILVSTLTALVILFIGYVLLAAINPDLIKFNTIQPPNVTLSVPTTAPSTVGTTSNSNFCQANTSSGCSNTACNNYQAQINAAAQQFPISGINTPALIKSIMINESSCNPAAQSSANSYGLMQLQTSTANQYASACGVSVNIDSTWLTNPNNSAQVICIGAKYLQALSSSCNGVLNIAAGYNGGAAACAQSVDCTGTDCDGSSAMKAWECGFDDTQHTIPNTGYNESRNYAPKVLGCYNANGGS